MGSLGKFVGPSGTWRAIRRGIRSSSSGPSGATSPRADDRGQEGYGSRAFHVLGRRVCFICSSSWRLRCSLGTFSKGLLDVANVELYLLYQLN
jgi:hypothetical protein